MAANFFVPSCLQKPKTKCSSCLLAFHTAPVRTPPARPGKPRSPFHVFRRREAFQGDLEVLKAVVEGNSLEIESWTAESLPSEPGSGFCGFRDVFADLLFNLL